MPKDEEIQRLKRRYELRAEGEYLCDLCDIVGENRARVFAAASSAFTGPDRLYFRQGFLFRCGQLGG